MKARGLLLVIGAFAALASVAAAWAAPDAGPADLQARLDAAVRPLERFSRTGVLYDRVLPLAHLERLDGTSSAPVIDAATWRQAFDELRRASTTPAGPDLASLDASARAVARAGVVPLALIDRAFERLRPDALRDGSLRVEEDRLVPGDETPLEVARAVTAVALTPYTYRGGAVTFRLDAERVFADAAPRQVEIDFADGRGFRPVSLGVPVDVRYSATGPRTVIARLERADGSTAEARFAFDVRALATPTPNDTLHVTAGVPYQGQYGTGEAYVYLAPGHTAIENPVIAIEGFDIGNDMNWDELYALLAQQNLIEDLRAEGFDMVVMNFTDATVAVEQNGLAVAELIQEVQAQIAPQTTIALVGASMGALCSRYALAWLETHAVPHRVRTWISFDGPHAGADIPLGLQYWVQFFSGQSASAAEFLATLQRPAAREMLIYHLTEPPGTTGQRDAQRDSLLAHFAAVGNYPSLTRRVAIANGSGSAIDQGFAPAAQLILYHYSSPLVAITGDVWAVPNVTNTTIFNGSLRILFTTTNRTVTVSGTQPWDGAPGGFRASMTQLDTTAAPYGDIVALHPAHCFIPTISSLALATTDPFFNVASNPDPVALSPFDVVHFPTTANQEHVMITPENAPWVRSEIERGVVAVAPEARVAALTLAAAPNPFRGEMAVTFTLPRAGRARLQLFDVGGRRVGTVLDGTRPAGTNTVRWDSANLPAGVLFLRLDAGGETCVRRIVRTD